MKLGLSFRKSNFHNSRHRVRSMTSNGNVEAPDGNNSPSSASFWCASELLVDQIPEDLALFLHALGQPTPADHRYALIIVNTPLCRKESFEMLWAKCGLIWGFHIRNRQLILC